MKVAAAGPSDSGSSRSAAQQRGGLKSQLATQSVPYKASISGGLPADWGRARRNTCCSSEGVCLSYVSPAFWCMGRMGNRGGDLL